MFFSGEHKISNLYDSHVHWMYTGQVLQSWNLKKIKDPLEILQEKLLPHYFRGDWVVGFGWDESFWPKNFIIHRNFLDSKFSQQPVFLSRNDGHSSWVNTAGLKKLGLWLPNLNRADIVVDDSGWPTGHLKEKAHIEALYQLPEFSADQKRQQLLIAAQHFNRNGFTHIRDMTSSLDQWKMNQQLLKEGQLFLHVEHWFVCESVTSLEKVIEAALDCKKDENSMMKLRGVKLFVDGSLGSHTAFISQPYSGQDQSGQMNWSTEDIAYCMEKIWSHGLEIALHSIGDECTHQIVDTARKVYAKGTQGRLHLEHVEILRPETIQMMKSLHVRCHLQPCHWFSDSAWLETKLPKLYDHAFPWRSLEKSKIAFSFGSDSPIEPSSFLSNLKAVDLADKKKIFKPQHPVINYHTYPYQDSESAETVIIDDEIKTISFKNPYG